MEMDIISILIDLCRRWFSAEDIHHKSKSYRDSKRSEDQFQTWFDKKFKLAAYFLERSEFN